MSESAFPFGIVQLVDGKEKTIGDFKAAAEKVRLVMSARGYYLVFVNPASANAYKVIIFTSCKKLQRHTMLMLKNFRVTSPFNLCARLGKSYSIILLR